MEAESFVISQFSDSALLAAINFSNSLAQNLFDNVSLVSPQRFAQEATKLHMLIHSCSSNLTRSASSAADQAGRGQSAGRGRGAVGSGPLTGAVPRRVETFAGYDKHNKQDKTDAGLYGDKRPSLEATGSDESVSASYCDRDRPLSSKSESTLKVKVKIPRSSISFLFPPILTRMCATHYFNFKL